MMPLNALLGGVGGSFGGITPDFGGFGGFGGQMPQWSGGPARPIGDPRFGGFGGGGTMTPVGTPQPFQPTGGPMPWGGAPPRALPVDPGQISSQPGGGGANGFLPTGGGTMTPGVVPARPIGFGGLMPLNSLRGY